MQILIAGACTHHYAADVAQPILESFGGMLSLDCLGEENAPAQQTNQFDSIRPTRRDDRSQPWF
jgi:hypothetical protein